MSSPVIMDTDDKREEDISLTPPPLPDKHAQIDMFSGDDQIEKGDQKIDEKRCSTPLTADDPAQEIKNVIPKKSEPVLGKERAIKILKAFGNQQKPVRELLHNALKTPTKESNKMRKEKKSLTPMEKAKETISQIEELKKFKDRTIPTYFGENVMIHHIKVTHLLNDRLDNHSGKSDIVDKLNNESAGKKSTVASLEALKAYNNFEADKQSDEEMISDNEESVLTEADDDMTGTKIFPAAFVLEAKRAKVKRRKRRSLDSRSSDKKRKRKHHDRKDKARKGSVRKDKDRKKKKSRGSLSRRSSINSTDRGSKKKRDSTNANE